MMGKSLFSCGAVCTALILILAVLKISSATTCGHPIISQRVVGGQNSTHGKNPWMASLAFRGVHICGASLISPNYVISAAHCTMKKNVADLMVVMGILTLEGYTSSRFQSGVERVTSHHNYAKSGDSGDVVVIKLKITVPYSNYIMPICLPEYGRVFPNGKMCILTGWGYTNEEESLPSPFILQEVELPLINYTVCEAMYIATFGDTYPKGLIHDDMVCAGYPDGSKDGCQGDSGGPLACYVDDRWVLTGLVSWGIGCARKGIAGIFTQVSNYTLWIISNTDLKNTQPSQIQPPKTDTTTVTMPTTTALPKPTTTTEVTTMVTTPTNTVPTTPATTTKVTTMVTTPTNTAPTTPATTTKVTTMVRTPTNTAPTTPATTTKVTTMVTTPTNTAPTKPATTTKVCIDQVTTAKPKNAAQSFNLTNDSTNSTATFFQGDDPTDCGPRSSSPMGLMAVGLILTKIWGIFQ